MCSGNAADRRSRSRSSPRASRRSGSAWSRPWTPASRGRSIESLASETIVTDPEPAAALRRAADGLPRGASPYPSGGADGVGVMLSGSWSSAPQPPRSPWPRRSASRAARARRRPWSRSSSSTRASVGRGEARAGLLPRRDARVRDRLPRHHRSAARRRRSVRARGPRGAARGRRGPDGRQGRAGRGASRLDRQAARRAALAAARALARERSADLVHDRDRHDRRHARPRAAGQRVPLR